MRRLLSVAGRTQTKTAQEYPASDWCVDCQLSGARPVGVRYGGAAGGGALGAADGRLSRAEGIVAWQSQAVALMVCAMAGVAGSAAGASFGLVGVRPEVADSSSSS
jgi:hypothetical protein